MTAEILPSWHEGTARPAVLDFLDSVEQIPPDERIAVFDNDGVTWCEKPNGSQLEFRISDSNQCVVGSQVDWTTGFVDRELS